ncbi:hypothetical protein Droror1_Dr00019848 [Drosera rotundifolia]
MMLELDGDCLTVRDGDCPAAAPQDSGGCSPRLRSPLMMVGRGEDTVVVGRSGGGGRLMGREGAGGGGGDRERVVGQCGWSLVGWRRGGGGEEIGTERVEGRRRWGGDG